MFVTLSVILAQKHTYLSCTLWLSEPRSTMALQALTLVQEITELRQTVARLEKNRPASPAHTATAAPINTLSITDIVANSLSQHGYESDASPSTPHHRRGGAGGWSVHGGLEPLLLEANSVVTNPVFLEGDFPGVSVPAAPNAPAPRLLQAVASQQVSLLHRPSHLERCMRPMCTTCSFCLHQHVLGACLQVTLAVNCMRMLWLRF